MTAQMNLRQSSRGPSGLSGERRPGVVGGGFKENIFGQTLPPFSGIVCRGDPFSRTTSVTGEHC
jgi:hypothetical protein